VNGAAGAALFHTVRIALAAGARPSTASIAAADSGRLRGIACSSRRGERHSPGFADRLPPGRPISPRLNFKISSRGLASELPLHRGQIG